MLAAEQGRIDNVKLLIAKGATVKARDQYGKGILDYALTSLNFELVKWLLSNVEEIDINQQDENGRTPLMNLLHETVSSGTDIHIIQPLVSYLLETGVKPDQVDKYGQSLQDYLNSKFLERAPKIVM
ncbi:ankyrin repeat domain-containing protein [Legionella pneumophila]|nr:ankyrin repeat domain-containing protein [Legionella pneumophila]